MCRPKTKQNDWYIILNPVSGKRNAHIIWGAIQSVTKNSNLLFHMEETKYRGHATILVKEAIFKGFRNFLTIGGDGVNSEVIDGIFKQNEVSPLEIIYTIIPAGMGNDWARYYGIPTNYKQWIHQILNQETKIVQQDVGVVHYAKDGKRHVRHFVNVAGMAYDAFLCKRLMEDSHPKNKYIYLKRAVQELFNYKPCKAKITFDDTVLEDEYYTINIGICRYSGGGMQFVPHAVHDDGLLALTVVTSVSKFRALMNIWRFYGGFLKGHSKVKTFETKKMSIDSVNGQSTYIEVDGDFIGETPVEIEVLPKMLNILVPSKF